ncbi:IS30 family transposase [Lactobacillus sp. XV13L]|nr:IS30 family transposase [Lactobacillus sp. XV13L]
MDQAIDRKSFTLNLVTGSDCCEISVSAAKKSGRQYPHGTSIEQRPAVINQWVEFGHWEVDKVLSSKVQSKVCLVNLCETAESLVLGYENSQSYRTEVFKGFMQRFGRAMKSITVNHGKEFARYQQLEQGYGLIVYFCHPYSPWKRVSNEYFNRKMRWFFPKKTNFDKVLEAVELINHQPLKLHNYHTAIEVFRACSD